MNKIRFDLKLPEAAAIRKMPSPQDRLLNDTILDVQNFVNNELEKAIIARQTSNAECNDTLFIDMPGAVRTGVKYKLFFKLLKEAIEPLGYTVSEASNVAGKDLCVCWKKQPPQTPRTTINLGRDPC